MSDNTEGNQSAIFPSETATCSCQNCSGVIEFPRSVAKQTMPCPHCGMDTILFIPPPTFDPKSRSHVPLPRLETIEDRLERIGQTLFEVGIVAACLCGLGTLALLAEQGMSMLSAMSVLTVFAFIGQGIIARALFSALAEMLRLMHSMRNTLLAIEKRRAGVGS